MKRSNFAQWAVLSFLLSSASLLAAEPTTTIIYLKDNAVSLTAPAGWLLDDERGRPRIQAMFYPAAAEGGEVEADAVIYINTLSRAIEPNLDALIADDVAHEREQSPKLQVRRGEPIRLSDGTSARVNHLSGDKWGNFESIAYIDTPADYVAIVLTCKTEAAHKKAQAPFAELVKSYRVLGPDAGLVK
jgi:hypothetical protein